MTYPSDMSDKQWDPIKDHFETSSYGKRLKYSKTNLTNTIFYRIKTGCQWRFLPKEYPLFRRLAKDFEIAISSAENNMMIAHSMILINRLG